MIDCFCDIVFICKDGVDDGRNDCVVGILGDSVVSDRDSLKGVLSPLVVVLESAHDP